MIRTVLVDDDALIHVTLRSLIDWERCGCTVVQDCSTGAQALAYLCEHPVDLLITDIKMPGMSGLELMAELRRNGCMPVTVALSGYDEFDLVREAFRLGAYDYLLKANINQEAVTQLLAGLREKVFHTAAPAALAQEGAPVLAEGDYFAAVFQVERFEQAAQRFGGNLKERMEKPMLELVRQIRRLQGRAVLRAKDSSRYELYYRVRDRQGAESTALSVARQIQGVWRDFMNLDTAAGISGVVPSAQLQGAVEQCEALCRLTVLRGRGGLCVQWEDGALARAYQAQAADCDELISALCGDSVQRVEEQTGLWFSALKVLKDREHIQEILVLLARLGERLEDYGVNFYQVFPERTDFHQLLREFESPAERELWLRNALRRVREACAEGRRERQKSPVQRAREFMEDNFANPELTLRTVADYVGFNEKYLSARFSKECGCTFVSYLNDLRLRRAQELLLQTDMRIYEISEAVGYSSVEHFTHMFKKKLCISPKDFRKGPE